MAHLRNIEVKCMECGIRRATCELFGIGNNSYGKFCAVCGNKRLQELSRDERERSAIRQMKA
jgi:hypothetical protein